MPPFDINQLLQMLPQLGGALKGGPEGAALMEGFRRGQQMRQQEELRKQQMGRQSRLDDSMLQTQQQTRDNMQADNARADEQQQMQKFQQMLTQFDKFSTTQGETATDPLEAQNANVVRKFQLEQGAGLAPGQLGSQLPNMTAVVSKGLKADAATLLERFTNTWKTSGREGEPSSSDDQSSSFTWQALTPRLQKHFAEQGYTPDATIKPSQLRALAGAVVLGPGQSKPKGDGASDLDRSFQREKAAREAEIGRPLSAKEAAALDREMRREVRAINAPVAAPRGGEPLAAVIGDDGQPVLMPRSQASGRRPANTNAQGRKVTSGDAGRIAEINTSLDDVDVLTQQLGTTGAESKFGAMLPNVITEYTGIGSDAKSRQAVIDRVKQVIGKALEGGVLRKEDEYKYTKILPTIGDPPEVAKTKLAGLKAALLQRRTRMIEALTDAGYDTADFPSVPAASDVPAAGTKIGRFEVIR